MSGEQDQIAAGFEWLYDQLRLLKVKNIEQLSRLGGFDSSLISHVKNGRKKIGRVFIEYITQGLQAAGYNDITKDVVAQNFGYWGAEEEYTDDVIAKDIAARLREIKDPIERQEAIKDINTDIQRAIERSRRGRLTGAGSNVGKPSKTKRGSG